ncbi:unnamed protein product, partial [Rotaria sp. Silwood1]
MDVPIRSGTNIVIFAFGLVDPDICRFDGDISYHDNRRGSQMIPLRFYANPPIDEKFAGLDSFEFRMNNYRVPSNETTYYCKVFKIPIDYPTKKHAIAYKVLINPDNRDLVHHFTLSECDPSTTFNDANLPEGVCDDVVQSVKMCTMDTVVGWATGGQDIVEYPEEAGYAIGGELAIKYYMIEMHYDNPNLASNRIDSSGIQFYIGKQLRPYDLGRIIFGTLSTPFDLAIPPQVNRFIVDCYCPPSVTQNFPESGITVVLAFPHTHLQGQSLWTKVVRNHTAIQYLFNAEAYDFNYQFINHLPKLIRLYR